MAKITEESLQILVKNAVLKGLDNNLIIIDGMEPKNGLDKNWMNVFYNVVNEINQASNFNEEIKGSYNHILCPFDIPTIGKLFHGMAENTHTISYVPISSKELNAYLLNNGGSLPFPAARIFAVLSTEGNVLLGAV